MAIWTSILKYGGTALKSTGNAVKATGKAVKPLAQSAVDSAAHPAQTLRGASTAVKGAAGAAAVGYVGWEKLTTDKSVARIVGDAIVGSNATDTLSEVGDNIKDLKNKTGQAVDSIGEAVGSLNSKWDGMSNFLKNITGGNGLNMFGNFFGNLAHGNVSGLGIAGLVAAAYMVFGRTGWLSKIAGALIGMMLIGNNAKLTQSPTSPSTGGQQQNLAAAEQETQSRGMRR